MGHAWGGEASAPPSLGLTLVRASDKKLFQDCKSCLLLLPAALSAPHAPHLFSAETGSQLPHRLMRYRIGKAQWIGSKVGFCFWFGCVSSHRKTTKACVIAEDRAQW